MIVFNRCLSNSAAVGSVKYQSNQAILNPYQAIQNQYLSVQDLMRYDVKRSYTKWIVAQC